MKHITIKGARVHNLKGIDVSIPKNELVVVTGVSGSGKSSLVFDILFEEGRRQYLQALGMLPAIADEQRFDSLTGIGPAVAVQQGVIRQSNPRSTVGTKTKLLGLLGVLFAGEGRMLCPACGALMDANLLCPSCGRQEERLEAGYFSANAPNGMCLKCFGRGATFELDLPRLAPDGDVTLKQIFDRFEIMPYFYRRFAAHLHTPFAQIPGQVKEEILHGHSVNQKYQKRSLSLSRILLGRILRGRDVAGAAAIRVCSECQGARIGEEGRRVLLAGQNIGDLGRMTSAELERFLAGLAGAGELSAFGRNLLDEIGRKLRFLVKMRLGHLSLYREMPTLSGGEIQRLFLTAHLDAGMDSLIYILDEPTMGLHEAEKGELLQAIVALKDLGNSVIVVEHDRNTIELAEHILDIGPRAGVNGGQIVYQGDYAGLLACPASLTGQYLSGRAVGVGRRALRTPEDLASAPRLAIRHARTNNLKDVSVSLPLGALVGVAGVSGSGKSSLISDTLVPLLKAHFHERCENSAEYGGGGDAGGENSGNEDGGDEYGGEGHQGEAGGAEAGGQDAGDLSAPAPEAQADRLEGLERLAGYAEVSQSPIGRHHNSNPASYTGIWDKIRALYARRPEAVRQGYTAGFFSFNSQGACTACKGSGQERTWLGGDFFVTQPCRECRGQRYHAEALAVRFQGKNIAEILDMPVSQALEFFAGQPAITGMLEVLERIGMGYVTLGQPAPSLSGGESQRIKLAREIGRRRKGSILYVLDEPTSGLSAYDTAMLVALLDELIAKGNSVVVIEHDPGVLSCCDWIIELGPGAGEQGGAIIAEGAPQDLRRNPYSLTGRYLA